MPKKNKKSRSLDPDLPDLETRKAYLLEIGMPSPYQGETTSSSSIDDSSSSPATNETEESNNNNTARPEKAADGSSTSDQTIVRPERPADDASTSTHQSVIDEILERPKRASDSESTNAHESFHDGRNIARAERAGDVASTSVHKSTDEDKNNVNEAESLDVNVHSKDSEPESYSNTAIAGVKPTVVADTQQTWKQETANPVDGSNITHSKDSENLGYSSSKTYPKNEQPTKCTPGKTVIPTVIPITIAPIKRTPDKSSKGKSDKTVTPTKHTTEVSSRIRTRSVTSAKGSPVVSSQEKSRPTIPTKYTTESSSRIRTRSATSAKGSPVVSSQEKSRPTKPSKYAKASSRIRTRSATSAKGSPVVSSQEKTGATTSNKFTAEVLSKEKRTATQTKYTTEVSSKMRTRSATSAKGSPVVSSQEKTRTTTRTKYTGVSSKEKITTAQTKYKTEVSTEERTSKSVKGSPEVLQKVEKTRTPIKSKSEAQLKEKAKIATPMEFTPNTSLQEKGEKTATTTKYTPESPSKEKTKSITPTKCTMGVLPEVRIRTTTPTEHTPEASPRDQGKKTITPTKYAPEVLSKESKKSSTTTKHMPEVYSHENRAGTATPSKRKPDASSKRTQAETPMKCKPVASSKVKCDKTITPTKCIPEASTKGREIKSKLDNGRTEPDVISLKEFNEPFEVDRIQTRNINLDVFEKAVRVDQNSDDTPGQEPKPVISTEEILEASASAVDKWELNSGVSNESKIETTVDPPTTTEPSVPLVTFEEFKRTLGTENIPPRRDDDLDVFNKALEKMEARRLRRVTFSISNEQTPSTSRVTPSPEKQLDNVSQNTKSASNINANPFGSTLTFEEFHRGLCTFGMINPELLKLDFFDKALEDMEKANSSQITEGASNISCKPEPLEESNEPHSSDEDINRSIAASGLETKHFRVVSSDDETEIALKSATRKISRVFLSKLEESEQRALVITKRISEEDLYLSESASKSSEGSLEESSVKSSEHDLVSSESLVKSSESEASPMESIGKSPEQEVESSEFPGKSTESEPSSEEFTGIHKGLEVYDPERISGFETSPCETKSSARNDSSESSEESELKSPKKRQRKSDTIVSVVEKSVGSKHRSRTQSENDLRKRRLGDKGLIPSKKRYSDEH